MTFTFKGQDRADEPLPEDVADVKGLGVMDGLTAGVDNRGPSEGTQPSGLSASYCGST